MHPIVLIGLFDAQGRLLMQERDSFAPTNPDQWTIIGGSVEADESPDAAAHRELGEETSLTCSELISLGEHEVPCVVHGSDLAHLFVGRTSATNADIVCGEGRQIVFLNTDDIPHLDLTEVSKALLPLLLQQATATEPTR